MLSRPQYQILLNPSAGKNRAGENRSLLEALLTKHEVCYDLHITKNEAHLRQLVHELAARGPLIGAGGDSTLTIIVTELVSAKIKSRVGMIGLGSQDDIVRSYGYLHLEEGVLALKEGHSKAIDLGVIKTMGRPVAHFVGQANIGLGASVNSYVAQKKLESKRWLTYWGIRGSLNAFRTKKIPVELAISFGEFRLEGAYDIALFSKIRYWAGGKLFVPKAEVDDSKLHMVLVSGRSFKQMVSLYGKATNGKHLKLPGVSCIEASKFLIEGKQPFQIQIDGEILSEGGDQLDLNSVEISVLPKAIEMIQKLS